MDIKNKVIIVTGATQGIGHAVAETLAEHGAKLVLAARDIETLREMEQELPGSLAVQTDMRKPGEIRNMIHMAVEKFGRVDVLINNAGQGMYGPVEKIDIEKYKEIMDLNVYGVLIAMQAVIPVMRNQKGGMILNVSSRVSKNYFPNLAAYASTKYALNALTLTARAELEKDNIIVSVFHPKMTATNFGKNAIGTRPAAAAGAARPNPSGAMEIDPPEAVAEHILLQLQSEEAEASM